MSDAIELYTRALFSKNTVDTVIAPSGAFGIAVHIPLNNPFLSATQRNAFCQFDTDPGPVYRPRFTPAECAAAANPALRPGDAAYRQTGTNTIIPYDVNGNGVIEAGETLNTNPNTNLSRRAVEVGPRISSFTTTIFDYRAGARGGITDSIDWDVFGTYGESQNIQTIQGYTLNSRVRQSLLAGGTAAAPVCFDPVARLRPGRLLRRGGQCQFRSGPGRLPQREQHRHHQYVARPGARHDLGRFRLDHPLGFRAGQLRGRGRVSRLYRVAGLGFARAGR